MRHRGLIFALVWLIGCVLAFQLGSRPAHRSGEVSDLSGELQSSSRSAVGAERGRPEAGAGLTALHKGGTVGRFLTFTKTLGDDELARLLPEMTEKMDEAEVKEALRRLLEDVRPGPARRIARFELIDRWAQLDAMAAFKHVDRMEPSPLRDGLKKRAIRGWASVDPAAAHTWIQGAADLPPKALRSVWEGIAKSNDIPATLAYIEMLGPGDNSYSEPFEKWDVYMTLHDLYRKDSKSVTKWVEDLPSGELRNRTLHSLVDQWARHDPEATRKWIEEHAGPDNKTVAYVELAESWGRHDPEAAVAWAGQLPPSTEGLRQIYERLFTRFIQYDFENAANYLVGQQPSPTLDVAFEVYIDKVKSTDPVASMPWAESITDPERRFAAMSSVASVWRGRDRAALERYVAEAEELSDVQRNTLLGKK